MRFYEMKRFYGYIVQSGYIYCAAKGNSDAMFTALPVR